MPAPLRWPIGHIGAKVEATPFTYNAPLVGDLFPAENIVWEPDIEINPQDSLRPFGFNKESGLTGMQKARISFEVLARGGTAAGTAGILSSLLKACAMSETVAASTSVTYKPASSSAAPYSFAVNRDGQLWPLGGGFGDCSISLDSSKAIRYSFSMSGFYVAPSAASMLSPTYTTVAPVVAKAVALTIGGQAYTASKVNISFGGDVGYRDDISTTNATGIQGAYVGNRRMKGSADLEMLALGTHDLHALQIARTHVAIQTGVIGATAGNRPQYSMPKCRITSVKPMDMGNRVGVAIEWEIASDISDAEGTDYSETWT